MNLVEALRVLELRYNFELQALGEIVGTHRIFRDDHPLVISTRAKVSLVADLRELLQRDNGPPLKACGPGIAKSAEQLEKEHAQQANGRAMAHTSWKATSYERELTDDVLESAVPPPEVPYPCSTERAKESGE